MGHQGNDIRITLIGAGTIGLSFAAFHLSHLSSPSQLTILDTRPDLEEYVRSTLPKFFPDAPISYVTLSNSLPDAVCNASIIQESGPENLPFKKSIWAEVEKYAPQDTLLWSSTSGIPASQQAADMQDKTRLLVVRKLISISLQAPTHKQYKVHPYNPPHIMPLLELVPSPQTSADVLTRTQEFWRTRGRVPILLKKEMTGFVANRLAFALLRESIHLVNEGVVNVEELDRVVETSMGPRWAAAGPFKSYHAGGGAGGLEDFFKNIGGTVQKCWDDTGKVNVGEVWEESIFRQTKEQYGVVDLEERDRITKRVLDTLEKEKNSG